MKTNTSRRDRGSALMLAFLAFIILAGIGAALFSMSLSGQRTTFNASNGDRTFHVAEGGIDDAVNKMNAYAANASLASADFAVIGKTEVVGGVPVNVVTGQVSEGSYRVTIEPPYAGLGTYKLISVGTYDRERRAIETYVVAENENSNFPFGLFGDIDLTSSGNVFTDSYKSSDPRPYSLQATNTGPKGEKYAGTQGNLGSNQDITISGSVSIFGNVTPGPDGDVNTSGSVHVNGSTTPAADPVVLAPVIYNPNPTIPHSGTLSMSGKTTKTLKEGEHRFTDISLSAQTALIFDGPGEVILYVDKDISISGQAEFQIKNDAKVTIKHGTGSISLSGGGLVNDSQKPKNFTINSASDGSVSISGNSAFYGVVNAPKAELKPSGTTDLFGAFVAKKITISGGAIFHYDEDIGGIASPKIVFKVKSTRQFVP